MPGTGLAKRIALDVARGLVFLHDRNVVHRDLKSANVRQGSAAHSCYSSCFLPAPDLGSCRCL